MEKIFEITLQNRRKLQHMLRSLSDEMLISIPNGFSNNIFWNIAHSITVAQILTYGLSGQKVDIPDDFVVKYGNGSIPEEKTAEEEKQKLDHLIIYTAEKTIEDYKKGVFSGYNAFTTSSSKITLNTIEDAIIFNNYHEGVHLGYIFALKKALSSS